MNFALQTSKSAVNSNRHFNISMPPPPLPGGTTFLDPDTDIFPLENNQKNLRFFPDVIWLHHKTRFSTFRNVILGSKFNSQNQLNNFSCFKHFNFYYFSDFIWKPENDCNIDCTWISKDQSSGSTWNFQVLSQE